MTLTQLLLNTYTNLFILSFNHLLYRHLLYRHLFYRQWIIPTSTRPSLDLRSPSAVHTVECIRDVSVCLAKMVMLEKDSITQKYAQKYTFDATATTSLQQLICANTQDVTDSSKLLAADSCNPSTCTSISFYPNPFEYSSSLNFFVYSLFFFITFFLANL